MEIIEGNKIAEKINSVTKERVLRLSSRHSVGIDIILVGEDFASSKYVSMKAKKAEELGMHCRVHKLSDKALQSDVLNLIGSLNNDAAVIGLMVQLPLPSTLDRNLIINEIDPNKDVDGLTAMNLGRLFQGNPEAIAPATPLGIMRIFEEYSVDLVGKDIVIVGSSTLVGIPLQALLLNRGATVTLTNKDTKDLLKHTSAADILISVVGKPGLITRSHVKPGAIVIDVGISRDPFTGKTIGDVDFDNVSGICSYITPVPGGVGPITVAALFSNLVRIAETLN